MPELMEVQRLPSVPVGRWLYKQRLVRGPIVDRAGHRCLFRIDHVNRTISLDQAIPIEERAQVLATAVAAAWRRIVIPFYRPRQGKWVT